jgi:hypothetical protein
MKNENVSKQDKAEAKRAARRRRDPRAFSAYGRRNGSEWAAQERDRRYQKRARPAALKRAMAGAVYSKVPMAAAMLAALAVKPEAPK